MRLLLLVVTFILFSSPALFSQRSDEIPSPLKIFVPTNHDVKLAKTTGQSFYQQKDKWQEIIDSTWGSGLRYDQKLSIFNAYTQALDDKYPCFPNLEFDWDSLKAHYRSEIDSSTSRGRFAAIMGHLAYKLQDLHTYARDSVVVYTPLNPGTPLLVLGGFNDISHFGAVLTVPEDNSIVVLEAAENHPLNLEPGDEILGYEGLPWLTIVNELLEAEVPIAGTWGGANSAYFDAKMICAGMNWHLFETIDILKFSSGDIQNLPTSSLFFLEIDDEWMYNNEQIDLPNISFPDFFWGTEFEGSSVSYGVLEGTNIGFIYLAAAVSKNFQSDNELFEAIHALQNTDGLIIDMRYNIGDWAIFDHAFDLLFNSHIYTLDDVSRCSADNYDLCPLGFEDLYDIPAGPNDFYDKPIAVLTGPSCASMGDITSYRLKYHPNVRLFGKSSNASLSWNEEIEGFGDWRMRYAKGDMIRVEDPDHTLNQKELPLDYPVWFSKNDIANGFDTVLEEAKGYINTLAHCYDAEINKGYSRDSVEISVNIFNPELHELGIYFIISDHVIERLHVTGSTDIESTHTLNYHLEEAINDFNSLTVITKDLAANTMHTLPEIVRFTTAGPVAVESYEAVRINDLNRLRITDLTLFNESQNTTIPEVRVKLTCEDSSVTNISYTQLFGDIAPQTSDKTGTSFYIDVEEIKNYTFIAEISSEEVVYWLDTLKYIADATSAEDLTEIPSKFSLAQNYPNPFNPTTTIKYGIPVDSKQYTVGSRKKQENESPLLGGAGGGLMPVELIIYDALGREVATLVNAQQRPGNYEVKWDASEQASGIYFYKLNAGNYSDTKKMVLLR